MGTDCVNSVGGIISPDTKLPQCQKCCWCVVFLRVKRKKRDNGKQVNQGGDEVGLPTAPSPYERQQYDIAIVK